MPPPGYVFRDGGVTPPLEHDPNYEFRQRILLGQQQANARKSGLLHHKTTTSHELATQNHELQGAAQQAGMLSGITNLGWQKDPEEIDQLVGGIDNEDLWMLIRRFNKQIMHVKSIMEAPPGGLDLNVADEDEFSPIKLRANIERLYMTVIIGMIAFGKHIVRLRSWREPRRTSAFAAVYTVAWLLGMVVPMSLITLVVLITVPRARVLMFPPAPIALVDSKTGGVQTPKAGVLGSHDSATGAPEKYRGQAVEQEASNLVSGIASVALSSAAGRHDKGDPQDGSSASKKLDKKAPDPTAVASRLADASASATGGQTDPHHDKTKQPMEDAIWAKMRPAMHVLGDVADTWERFGNALSPTPPFDEAKRLQLAAIFAPLLLLSLFVRPQWFVQTSYILSGVIFFTDPQQQQAIAWLNHNIPDWPKYLKLNNHILYGVPTNAQLTITLLRIGEANRAPLPPPPSTNGPPPNKPAEIDRQELIDSGLDTSHAEIQDAITADHPNQVAGANGSVHPDEHGAAPQSKKKSGFGAKIMSGFKHATAAVVETKLTTDNVRAVFGSDHAKQKLGILPSKQELQQKPTEGPVEFKGRYKGSKGAVYVDSSVSPASGNRPESPCVYFTTHLDGHEVVESMPEAPKWAVAIRDIVELKKVGGLGWKGRIIVGWATDREVKDGIVIVDRMGHEYQTTALGERDELFNRLVAMGQQIWEAY